MTAQRVRARVPAAAHLQGRARIRARLAVRHRPQRGARRAAPAQAQAALAAEPADVDAAPAEDAADAAFQRVALRAAVATLPPRERELIALKFHAGLDNAELAAVLGVTVSNAGTLLHRAVQKLRKAIDEHA